MATLTQGSTFEAKQDTVFASTNPADITVDLSQYGTNLTALAPGGYELASSRSYLLFPRTLYCRATFGSGLGVYHGNPSLTSNAYTFGSPGGSALRFYQDTVQLHSYGGGAFSSAQDCSVQWATRANPDTTGASNALLSEVIVYNHATGTWGDPESFTHGLPATGSAGDTLSVGGIFDGASAMTFATSGVFAVRIDRRFHTTVEFGEDWVAQRSAGVPVVEPLQPIWPALAVGDSAASSGAFAGQAQIGEAARSSALAVRRLISPLWNVEFRNNDAWGPSDAAGLVFGHAKYRSDFAWIRWANVPRGVSAARVRVHVHSRPTAGAAVPLGVRVYSSSQHPGETVEPPAYVESVLTEDHGGGLGEWIDLGTLELRVNASDNPLRAGTTCLVLAVAVDPNDASANDANEEFKINAIQVWPVGSSALLTVGVIDD